MTPPDLLIMCNVLQTLYRETYDDATIAALAEEIAPYVERSRMPLEEAVEKIAPNYLRDGQRVQLLLSQPSSPDWDMVLEQVIAFASKHSLYPRDTEATSWPDLDAYNDVRRNLSSYNFEGSLDHWITVAVVNRLRRYWRDRKSLSAGGPGFKQRGGREADDAEHDHDPPKVVSLSLEQLIEQEWPLVGAQARDAASVVRDVEDAELYRLMWEAVSTLAVRKRDALLPALWHVVIEQGWRLREAAESFGLTISQVHRRIEQTRSYLREDPAVRQWLRLGE
jgi:RNA polymerase sigma factor (sigma-70 family)